MRPRRCGCRSGSGKHGRRMGSQERLKEGGGVMGEGRWILGGRSTACNGQVLFEKLGAGAQGPCMAMMGPVQEKHAGYRQTIRDPENQPTRPNFILKVMDLKQ